MYGTYYTCSDYFSYFLLDHVLIILSLSNNLSLNILINKEQILSPNFSSGVLVTFMQYSGRLESVWVITSISSIIPKKIVSHLSVIIYQ